jgi:hypothetical protein
VVAAIDDGVRRSRWRLFQIVFSLTCVAIVLDLWTTYLGFQREGSRFEQNGIVLYLLQHVGWFGISVILAVACAACFRSFRTVYWNLGLRWSLWLNIFLILACSFRWLVVVTDTLWLMR